MPSPSLALALALLALSPSSSLAWPVPAPLNFGLPAGAGGPDSNLVERAAFAAPQQEGPTLVKRIDFSPPILYPTAGAVFQAGGQGVIRW